VDGSGIYRRDFSPKPAATALRTFWRDTHNTSVTAASLGGGRLGWRGYFGTYAYALVDGIGGGRYEGTFEAAPMTAGNGGAAAQEVVIRLDGA